MLTQRYVTCSMICKCQCQGKCWWKLRRGQLAKLQITNSHVRFPENGLLHILTCHGHITLEIHRINCEISNPHLELFGIWCKHMLCYISRASHYQFSDSSGFPILQVIQYSQEKNPKTMCTMHWSVQVSWWV